MEPCVWAQHEFRFLLLFFSFYTVDSIIDLLVGVTVCYLVGVEVHFYWCSLENTTNIVY